MTQEIYNWATGIVIFVMACLQVGVSWRMGNLLRDNLRMRDQLSKAHELLLDAVKQLPPSSLGLQIRKFTFRHSEAPTIERKISE